METTIQETIFELNDLSNHYYTLSEYDTCHGIGLAVELLITKLEKEKQQLFHSFNNGADKIDEMRFNKFFNNTYKLNT